MSLDATAILSNAIAASAGIGGLVWGIHTYKQSLILQRKEILFSLIDQFDNSESMFIAKSILDGFTFSQDYFYEPDRTSWKNRYMREEYEWSGRVGKDNFGRDWFGKLNLNTVLRNHEVEPVVKVKQKEIRSSFDSLLDFFGKLEYLLTNHLIKNKEIGYFRLYLEKAAEVQAIQQYIRIYRFPLYGKLNSKLRYDYHE